MVGASAFFLLGLSLVNNENVLSTTKNAGKVYAAENNDLKEKEIDEKIYGIGSVSKTYTAAAIMQLADSGKIDIDDPVTDYIDDFTMADERYKDITVRMLLNHTSGIAGTSAKNMFLYGDNDFVATDSVLKNLKNQKLKADPGEYAAYCNDGFELLEIIRERVSGMRFTDYITKNIAGKIGANDIYTAKNVFENDALADIYPDGKNRYDMEYVVGFGTGGIYSTAVDTCEFGSTFFKGDNRLLSEKSKDEMAALWSDNSSSKYDTDYMDQCGLGWDLTSIPMYEDAGVKAVYKGGDALQYHAALMVAPEEEISVCVTTSGGSSEYNLAMAEALANIALEEKGIDIEEPAAPDVTVNEVVPDSYKKYEGFYTLNGIPAMITFPDMRYMRVEMLGNGTSVSYYMYCDRGFVKVSGDVENGNYRIDKNYTGADIVEIDGHVYVTQEMIENNTGLIGAYQKTYIGEKLAPNPVSENVLNAWKERDGNKYEMVSEKYSSEQYSMPFAELYVLEDTGYAIYIALGDATIYKIIDENHLGAFATIPSSSNRDYKDIYVDESGVTHSSIGIDMIPVSGNENFTGDVKEVSLTTDKAVWYNIDKSMTNQTISLDCPDNSAVFVYDKYGKVTYCTPMVDYGNIITNSYKYANTKIDVDYSLIDDYLEMKIRDYGPGVSEEELPAVTNKFYRGKDAEKRQKEGSGLGLYISKSFMEKMDGDLICERADENGGFSVKLLIPLS